MASVWYTGQAHVRVITEDEWTRRGTPGQTVQWSTGNEYSVPRSVFSDEQIAVLEEDPDFDVDAPDGPYVPPTDGFTLPARLAAVAQLITKFDEALENGFYSFCSRLLLGEEDDLVGGPPGIYYGNLLVKRGDVELFGNTYSIVSQTVESPDGGLWYRTSLEGWSAWTRSNDMDTAVLTGLSGSAGQYVFAPNPDTLPNPPDGVSNVSTANVIVEAYNGARQANDVAGRASGMQVLEENNFDYANLPGSYVVTGEPDPTNGPPGISTTGILVVEGGQQPNYGSPYFCVQTYYQKILNGDLEAWRRYRAQGNAEFSEWVPAESGGGGGEPPARGSSSVTHYEQGNLTPGYGGVYDGETTMVSVPIPDDVAVGDLLRLSLTWKATAPATAGDGGGSYRLYLNDQRIWLGQVSGFPVTKPAALTTQLLIKGEASQASITHWEQSYANAQGGNSPEVQSMATATSTVPLVGRTGSVLRLVISAHSVTANEPRLLVEFVSLEHVRAD